MEDTIKDIKWDALKRLICFGLRALLPSMLWVMGKVSVGRPVILQQEER